jgi:hypothetical protein
LVGHGDIASDTSKRNWEQECGHTTDRINNINMTSPVSLNRRKETMLLQLKILKVESALSFTWSSRLAEERAVV